MPLVVNAAFRTTPSDYFDSLTSSTLSMLSTMKATDIADTELERILGQGNLPSLTTQMACVMLLTS